MVFGTVHSDSAV